MAAGHLLVAAGLWGWSPVAGAVAGSAGQEASLKAAASWHLGFIFNVAKEFRRTSGTSVTFQEAGLQDAVRLIDKGQVDLALVDLPIRSSSSEANSLCKPLRQIPICGQVIELRYNLPGVLGFKLTGPLIADIYLGHIKRWDDPLIRAVNRSARLPSLPIYPIHTLGFTPQADLFTRYLHQMSPRWRSDVGSVIPTHWPAGVETKNQWTARNITVDQKGAICYEWWPQLPDPVSSVCRIRNGSGRYVSPSEATASAALAEMVPRLRQDITACVLDAPGRDSYPIVGYSYLSLRQHDFRRESIRFALYMLGPGQRIGRAWGDVGFVPVPPPVARLGERLLDELEGTGNG